MVLALVVRISARHVLVKLLEANTGRGATIRALHHARGGRGSSIRRWVLGRPSLGLGPTAQRVAGTLEEVIAKIQDAPLRWGEPLGSAIEAALDFEPRSAQGEAPVGLPLRAPSCAVSAPTSW
jgi:hypothetical protein